MRKIVFSALILLLSFTSLEAFVDISPALYELSVKRGSPFKGVFTVTNTKDVTVVVSMEVHDWWKEQTGNTSNPPEQWLSIKADKPFTLKAGESRKVKFKVNVTKDLNGEAAAMIFFNITEPGGYRAMNLQLRHGVPIYVINENSSNIQAESLAASAYVVTQSTTPTVQFAVKIANKGNVHIRPKGFVILSAGNEKIGTADIDWGWPIYPGLDHVYTATMKDISLASGTYTAAFDIQYGEMYHKDIQLKKTITFTVNGDNKIEVLP